jgi:hypothetical protein
VARSRLLSSLSLHIMVPGQLLQQPVVDHRLAHVVCVCRLHCCGKKLSGTSMGIVGLMGGLSVFALLLHSMVD